jgi:ParB family chromosome partitioning protein
MPVETPIVLGQVLRLDPIEVHVPRLTSYEPFIADGVEFQRLRESILFMSGNVQPVGVRRFGRWPEGCRGGYELIFGHQRWQACRELGIPVLAVLDEIGDRELLVHFTAEHMGKIERFPWRFGTACHRSLDMGLFPSMRRLGEALDVPLMVLSLAMKLADLPLAIRQLFHHIDMSWAVSRRLVERFERDPDGMLRAAERAQRLSGVSPLHAFRKAFPDHQQG